MSATPERVEKLMALTLADFHRSLIVLAPAETIGSGQTVLSLPVDRGQVAIEFTPLKNQVLGGLLSLPRASVTLTFDAVDETAQRAFLARFDQAFQRGGG